MRSVPGLTREWEVFIVHATHVDIGYTAPQPLVERRHAEFIARALDECSATDCLPPGERFCWTCEVAWTVRQFLKHYPERAAELFRRVREGRIEITGLYVQLTDLFTAELLDDALDYTGSLAREHGFEIPSAMNDDVNGWAWGLPRLLNAHSIRYFDVGINETFSMPVRPRPWPFYWSAPGGERVMMWHGGGYMQGNAMGMGQPGDFDRMVAWLKELENGGYPHAAVELRLMGAACDNAPPGAWICRWVHEWNLKYANPRLRLVTPRSWFEHLEKCWPQPLQEWRAAWPDWWAAGNGSALYESALVRKSQADILTARRLASSGLITPDRHLMESAVENAMLFCEHTWGAWCSTDAPDSFESRSQWNLKAGYAYRAAIDARELVVQIVRGRVPSRAGGSIAVLNPDEHSRTDLVELCVADSQVPGGRDSSVMTAARIDEGPVLHLIEETTGADVPVQREPVIMGSARKAGQVIRFIARDIPPGGIGSYRIESGAIPVAPKSRIDGNSISSPWYILTVDPLRGGIVSLIDRVTGRELIAVDRYACNQLVYERIDATNDRDAFVGWEKSRNDTPFVRNSPVMRLVQGSPLPFGARLVMEGDAGVAGSARCEFIVYDDLPRVDIVNTLVKPPVSRAEGIYQAFSIAARQPVVWLDVPGAAMRPGIDQVPGTATDWHGIQHYFAVADDNYTVVVASPDVPLVQVNGINTGLWQKTLAPHNGLVMTWVLNNYWFTNFPATQGGTLRYRYSLSGWPGAFDAARASSFAMQVRMPLVADVSQDASG